MLGIDAALIGQFGAVSAEVARAMAAGAIDHSLADFAISVTGIAGPGGGTPDKPVGLVWLACHGRDGPVDAECHRFGDIGRAHVRLATVDRALRLLSAAIDKQDYN